MRHALAGEQRAARRQRGQAARFKAGLRRVLAQLRQALRTHVIRGTPGDLPVFVLYCASCTVVVCLTRCSAWVPRSAGVRGAAAPACVGSRQV